MYTMHLACRTRVGVLLGQAVLEHGGLCAGPGPRQHRASPGISWHHQANDLSTVSPFERGNRDRGLVTCQGHSPSLCTQSLSRSDPSGSLPAPWCGAWSVVSEGQEQQVVRQPPSKTLDLGVGCGVQGPSKGRGNEGEKSRPGSQRLCPKEPFGVTPTLGHCSQRPSPYLSPSPVSRCHFPGRREVCHKGPGRELQPRLQWDYL